MVSASTKVAKLFENIKFFSRFCEFFFVKKLFFLISYVREKRGVLKRMRLADVMCALFDGCLVRVQETLKSRMDSRETGCKRTLAGLGAW